MDSIRSALRGLNRSIEGGLVGNRWIIPLTRSRVRSPAVPTAARSCRRSRCRTLPRRAFAAKRKSVANNICDHSSNGAPDHGRRKLDSLAVIGRSKRGYGGSPNGGLPASPARGRLKCLPAEGGHGCGAVNYGADASVRVAGAPEKATAAETSKTYNNNKVRAGEGQRRKGRKSEEQCSRDLVMEKVIILKRGQTIQDVAAEPSDDAGTARVCGRKEMAEGKVNWHETPARVRVEWDARSAVGSDLTLGEIGGQDVQKNAEQMWKPREGLRKTPAARPEPNPSTASPERVGILRPVSVGSRQKSWDEEEMLAILPGSGGFVCSRGGRSSPPGSGQSLEKEEEEEESSSSAATSSSSSPSPSPVFMLEKWAGPPYCKSPSPRCLPLPRFSMQQKGTSDANAKDSDAYAGLPTENGNCSPPETLNMTLFSLPVLRSCGSFVPQAGVDAFATRGLRRLLHLD